MTGLVDDPFTKPVHALIFLILVLVWLNSGYMCVTGQDYSPLVLFVFRPCGLFVIPYIVVAIIFVIVIMPGLHG